MALNSFLSKLTIVAAMSSLVPLGAAAAVSQPCVPGVEAQGRPAPALRSAGSGPCADHAADCCAMRRGSRARAARAGRQGAAHHDNIHALLDSHEAIQREVKEIDRGVETVTTSDDPAVTRTIRQHVRQMQQRMESGQGLRWWDPLFAELFRRHDEVRMEIEEVPGGVLVRETSDDAAVVALIRQHALRGVSEFVESGYARAHQPTPLPEGYAGADPDSAGESWQPPCMR